VGPVFLAAALALNLTPGPDVLYVAVFVVGLGLRLALGGRR
jgi:threonine/homoserine/homoserine lactone efflux protein